MGGDLVKILIVYKLVLSFPCSTKAYFAFSLISGSFLPSGICRRGFLPRDATCHRVLQYRVDTVHGLTETHFCACTVL